MVTDPETQQHRANQHQGQIHRQHTGGAETVCDEDRKPPSRCEGTPENSGHHRPFVLGPSHETNSEGHQEAPKGRFHADIGQEK